MITQYTMGVLRSHKEIARMG